MTDVAAEPEAPPQTVCPFCEEPINPTAGKHLAMHRQAGEAPLPLEGEVVGWSDGTWGFTLVTMRNRLPIFVGEKENHLPTRADAQKALNAKIDRIAHGQPKSKKGRRNLKVVQTEVKPKPSTDFDQNILAALDKLIGGVPVRAKDIPKITAWVEQTRRLVQELS